MLTIAIVEDNDRDAAALESCLDRFGSDEKVALKITRFRDGMEFIEGKHFDFDVIYMDIEMPLLGGMDAAKAMREAGCRSALIFVTNMAQYAIHGYRVEATDFVLKPVRYASVATLLKKLLPRFSHQPGEEIALFSQKGVKKLRLDSIRYIESEGHKLTFHTEDGDIEDWSAMKKVLAALPVDRFVRCNNSYIVQMSFIKEIKIQSVLLDNGEELIVSRNKRKELLKAYQTYLLDHGVTSFV